VACLVDQFHQFRPVGDLLEGQVFHRCASDDQPVQWSLGQRFLPAHVEILEVLLIPAFVGMGSEPDPHRFDLQNRQPEGVEQVEFVLLAQGHDVQNADPQGPDVLTLRLGGFDPGDPVAFDGTDLVVVAGKDQCHGQVGVVNQARACSKSALMSSMCSSPTETRTMVGVTPAEACSSSLSCWWVVEAGWITRVLASPTLAR